MENYSISKEQILKNLNFTSLNPMQEQMLKIVNQPGDVVLYSPTGSGKTLGFLLPLLPRVTSQKDGIQAIILVPSRELGIQIEQVIKSMGTGLKVTCCYGGHSIQTEKNSLKFAPVVLVGTPGRIADHIERRHLNPETIHTLVLDEFDKSLELGFQKEMAFIIDHLRGLTKRILISATKMKEIPDFARLGKFIELDFLKEQSPQKLLVKSVRSIGNDKLETLFRLVCAVGNETTLVFCNHREAVDRISQLLWKRNLVHEVYHGGMEQEERVRSLIKFRNGSHRLLITTDLASRGLDIPEIRNIIHYQLPLDEKSWTHRNGRTARMNASGTSFIVLSETEYKPPFIEETPEIMQLPELIDLPAAPDWVTLYVGGGKKDKINKIDIVGFLLQKGQLQKEDLGLIEVLDYESYVAVKQDKVQSILKLVKNESVKKKKIKIAVSQ